MATWHVIAQTVSRPHGDEQRFVVWLIDPGPPSVRGPDGGADHKGYTEQEFRMVLSKQYGQDQNAVDALIAAAKIKATVTR